MVKVIIIDSAKKEIREALVENKLEVFQEIVGGYIEQASRSLNGDILYVDEDGIYRDYQTGFFFRENFDQRLLGDGVITGLDKEGNTVDVVTTVEIVKNQVKFFDKDDLLKKSKEN